nr:cellulase family glycosylhydrolase [Ardenticatena sp.]
MRRIMCLLFLLVWSGVACTGETVPLTPTNAHATPTSTPTPAPPAPFTLLFSSDRGGAGGVYTLDMAGGEPRPVLTRRAGVWDPTPSPDGRRFVFTDYTAENGDLVLATRDGMVIRRLTTHPADDYWPAWSPDGRWVAFVSERDGGQDLYLLDVPACLEGTCRPQRLTAESPLWRHRYPAWAPDGTLVFAGLGHDGLEELYRLNVETGALEPLTQWPFKASHPAVAPDGLIAAVVWRDAPTFSLAILPPEGGTPQRLWTSSNWLGSLSWTPDGRAILFTMWNGESHDVYLLPREGGVPQRLTTSWAWDDTPVALPGRGDIPTEKEMLSLPPPTRRVAWGANVADLSNAYLLHDLGFTWVKGFADWNRIEPEQGTFFWQDVENTVEAAERAGLRLLLRVHNAPPWARPPETPPNTPPVEMAHMAGFMTTLATRYGTRVPAYEIWNEPNLAFEWGNQWPEPSRYAEMVRQAQAGLALARSESLLVAGAVAVSGDGSAAAMGDLDFLRAWYAAGARGTFDRLSTHPYGFGRPPDTPPDAGLGMRRTEEQRALMEAAGDAETPMWLTEMGWVLDAPAWNLGEHEHSVVPRDVQARYWCDAVAFIDREWPWVEAAFVFNLDFSVVPWYPAGEQMRWYALLNPDRSPRPAYSALRQCMRD